MKAHSINFPGDIDRRKNSMKDDDLLKSTRNLFERSSVVLMQEAAEIKMIPGVVGDDKTIIDVDNVHITPRYIEFTDASEGLTRTQRIVVKNNGTEPAFVKIRKPNSIAFQVKTLKTAMMLNPGLSVSTYVTYSFKRPSFLHATIPIEINGKIIDYRVICTLTTEHVTVEPKSIDFGIIDIRRSSGVKIISIYNDGGKSTRFSVDLGKNDLELTVRPLRGVVRPYKKFNLRVEFMAMNEGIFYDEFWIISSPNIRIPLKVQVIVPHLIVCHLNTTGDFTLIDFPPTVENTCNYDTFVLRNISSQVASYVVLSEINNELKCIRDINRKEHPEYGAFDIRPIEGRMDPFEGIVFEIRFSPSRALLRSRRKLLQRKQMRQLQINDEENDFMAFIRIIRVHCTESENMNRIDPKKDASFDETLRKPRISIGEAIMDISASSTSSTSSVEYVLHDVVRCCLHGETEVVRLNFEPDVLYFGDLYVDQVSQRVVRISNSSKIISVEVRYVPTVAIYCYPKKAKLKASGSIEVLVKIFGRTNVPSSFEIFFDAFVDSYDTSVWRHPITVKVGSYPVRCTTNIICKTNKPKIKFVTGITPLITHEVGLTTDRATFGSRARKPRQAMLLARCDASRPWANERLIRANRVVDSVPAYPNDTQRSLRPYRGPPVRTIFTGQLRYTGGPRNPEALSVDEATRKTKQCVYWTAYLRSSRLHREKEEKIQDDSCGVCYDDDDDDNAIPSFFPTCSKFEQNRLLRLLPCQNAGIDQCLTSKTKAETLIPLSPLHIYNVHVYPPIFTFGMVASKTLNYRQLAVENRNNFSVMLRFISLSTRNIKFPEGDTMILSPGQMIAKLVEFRADRIGKFNGYIDYKINDNHSFELGVTADVVPKHLSLDKREIIFANDRVENEAYRPTWSLVQIRNKLDAKTSFKWEVPAASSFTVLPMFGTVRGNSNLYVCVSYNPNPLGAHYSEAIMKCESGSYAALRMSVSLSVPKVDFANEFLNLGEIPLNLPTHATGVLQNSEFMEIVYEVDVESLVQGCEIHPLRGVIPPRGIAVLEASFTFGGCFQFSTIISIVVQKCLRLQWKVNGSVVFPRLKFSPSTINQGRVYVNALRSHSITTTNFGTTKIKLKFLLDKYPEFTISTSLNEKNLVDKDGLVLLPGASQCFHLHFRPVDLASYGFYLPIVINDLLGPVSITDSKSLQPSTYMKVQEDYYTNFLGFTSIEVPNRIPTIFVESTVAGQALYFNKMTFSFNVQDNKIRDEFIVENRETPLDITLIIDTDGFTRSDCPFSISWMMGAKLTMNESEFEPSIACTLPYGQFVVFALEFKPKERGRFDLKAPILIRMNESEDKRLFNRLLLDGEYASCSIETDTLEIYFLPIPLRTAVEERLQLKARHFESPTSVTWKLLKPERCNGDFKQEMINVRFSKDNFLPAAPYTELDVIFTFKSDSPISFCLTVEFQDVYELATCSVTVYATADDHLLTTHAHFKTSPDYQRKLRIFEKRTSICSMMSDSDTEENEFYGSQHFHKNRPSSTTATNIRSIEQSTASIMKSDMKSGVAIPTTMKEDEFDAYSHLNAKDEKETTDEYYFNGDEKYCQSIDPISVHHKSIKENYPYCPCNDNTEYANYMRDVILTAENWLYANVFKFAFYPNILDGITVTLSNICVQKPTRRHLERKRHSLAWSFIDALETLVGRSIYDHIDSLQPLPDDPLERIEAVLRNYEKMLNFLFEQGAHLVHVSPVFLLNYKDYAVIMNPTKYISRRRRSSIVPTPSQQLTKERFESRSRQCWLDVILQTYKCFVFSNITVNELKRKFTLCSVGSSRRSTSYRDSTVSSISLRKITNTYEKVLHNIVDLTHQRTKRTNRSSGEVLLFSWLEYHYEEQRVQDWMIDRRALLNPHECKDIANQRNIEDLDSDLSDCVVLIAVTGAYCPFLIHECFSMFYIFPRNMEEALHNAICLVDAWEKIRLGFIINPMQIVHPNSVQMLMLVVHLFQTLPSYTPSFKLKFSCSLTETVTRQASFSNSTDNFVDYLLLFVGNNGGFFSLTNPQSRVRVNARDTVQIKISFHAKKIRKIKAYLLLCGSAYGPHFGRNQTLVLEGYTDNLAITNEYTVLCKLYHVINTTLAITVPYENSAEYEIWLTNERPAKPAVLKATKWSELRTRKIPRRLFLNQKCITVDEKTQEANLSITMACITPKSQKFWLIFQSKLGDFIIQINSQCQVAIMDHIVVEYIGANGECICADLQSGIDEDCQLVVDIPIPSRNLKLWSCVSHMFQKTLDVKERQFWSRYLDTHIGLRLIHWLMGSNTDSAALEIIHIFNTKVTYNVTISDKTGILMVPEFLTIPDVRPSEHVTLISHRLPQTPKIYEAILSMISQDGKEVRLYGISLLEV